MTQDDGSAQTIGALILFAIFVSAIAVLNVTAVPNAGLAAEEEHFLRALTALNGLQAEAEGASTPGSAGAGVARALDLSPPRSVGQDFFSFFLASPARASGELVFDPAYGNVSLRHTRHGQPGAIYDIGSESDPLPLGRLRFDPHPVFRAEGAVDLENGAVLATGAEGALVRYEPAITLTRSGDNVHVAIKIRILNGTGASVAGSAPVRVGLTAEAAMLNSPQSQNAASVHLRMETDHAEAWASHLRRLCESAGLGAGECTATAQGRVVAWDLAGPGDARNDIRLTTGLAVHTVALR